MKNYLGLITLSAGIHRKQSRMTRICIMLAVFLVTVMFGLADGYLQGEIRRAAYMNGNWHYGFSLTGETKAEFIAGLPEVNVSGWQLFASGDAGYTYAGQPLALVGQEGQVSARLFPGMLTEGTYPDREDEIAVSSVFKESHALKPGDSFVLTLPGGGSASFTVSGFLEGSAAGCLLSGESRIACLTAAGMQALAGSSGNAPAGCRYVVQFSRFANMQKAASYIQNQLSLSPGQVVENEILLSMLGQKEGSNISRIYGIALFLSGIVMLTCVLMIAGSMNSNVIQRTEFFGRLRCLGATRRQIMRFVQREGLYWCKSAIPAGIAAAVAVVWAVSAMMRAISPERLSYMPVFGISPISIAAGVSLGLLTVLLAGRSPAGKAARVSPLTAVSGNAGYGKGLRKCTGIRFFKIETSLGVLHAWEAGKIFFLMAGAYAVCIILFLAFSTITDFMKNAMQPLPWTPELSVVSADNTCSIEKSLFTAIKENSRVKRAYGRMFAYDIPGIIGGSTGPINLISYEENQFAWAQGSLAEGAVEPVMQEENQVLLVAGTSAVHAGDRISLTVNGREHTVTVAGILSDSPLARGDGRETVICSEQTFTGLTGQEDYTIIDVQFQRNASAGDVAAVKALFTEGVVFSDKFLPVREQKDFYTAFSLLAYGFLFIIASITVFHIRNTIAMSAAARQKQYGVMRAIGMSDRQLVKMMLAETVSCAACGCVAGCILGIPLHWVLFASLITTFWGIPWSIPFAAAGTITGIVFITALLAVYGPARHICRMPAVEIIRAQ